MNHVPATGVNTPSPDSVTFGAIAILHGSALVDALCHLRQLAREGSRSKSSIELEIDQLIDNSRSSEALK